MNPSSAQSTLTIDEIWAAMDSQRSRTADLLESLTDEQWDTPSLCAGWTVRHVAAHLTMQQMSLWTGLKGGLPILLSKGGGTNGIIHHSAIAAASKPKDQIIREIRAMLGSRKRNFSIPAAAALIDSTIHAQDIAIPLGVAMPIPLRVASSLADTFLTSPRRLTSVFEKPAVANVTLVATDTDWVRGSGAEVRGPMHALLLMLTGRDVALAELDGPGLSAVRGLPN